MNELDFTTSVFKKIHENDVIGRLRRTFYPRLHVKWMVMNHMVMSTEFRVDTITVQGVTYPTPENAQVLAVIPMVAYVDEPYTGAYDVVRLASGSADEYYIMKPKGAGWVALNLPPAPSSSKSGFPLVAVSGVPEVFDALKDEDIHVYTVLNVKTEHSIIREVTMLKILGYKVLVA